MKIGPAARGKVRAAITFKPPAVTGGSAITGYRVQVISQDPALNQDGTEANEGVKSSQSCSTRKTTCTVTLTKVKTSDDLFPAMYTVTVRAVNAKGLGAASELSVQAK